MNDEEYMNTFANAARELADEFGGEVDQMIFHLSQVDEDGFASDPMIEVKYEDGSSGYYTWNGFEWRDCSVIHYVDHATQTGMYDRL